MNVSAINWIPDVQPCKLAQMPRPRAGEWLAEELLAWKGGGVDIVLSLLEKSEVSELGLSSQAAKCHQSGLQFLSFPIPDRSTPPSIGVVIRLVDSLVLELRTGKGLVIHCRAGIGRSGMIAACVLLRLGMPFGEVFPVLSRARRVPVPDTEAQVAWVKNFDRELRLRRNG